MAAPGLWVCSNCSVEQMAETTYCHMCKFARPMDRRGVPQIFSGYNIHFNGIIPRTIMHPSHSVEWRMAERHGATCCTSFDPAVVSILVYRPGYERSEKCRTCLEHHPNIPCVPIAWLLDSLLQSRQIHPSLYRLTRLLPVANPTVGGTDLPHHQHPFYQINKSEYSIPTSFPPSKNKGPKKSAAAEGANNQNEVPGEMEAAIPPFFDIEPFRCTAMSVFDAAVACATGVKTEAVDDDNDKIEARKTKPGIELIAAQQPSNKVDRALFSGMNVVLTPSLQGQTAVVMTIQRCGGKIAEKRESLEATLRNNVTHVIYSHEDKKDDVMIQAAHLISTNLPGLQLAQSNWLEDCLILGELLPLRGMYTPTAKLLETLNKKYTKARS
ncbi:BRCA1 C Terminus (BRCT) domain containing protein [Leishmania donovani]|nr:BRCA1 C Terminus (BRCT) domain family protein [Leishmania donovani]TPP44737.1 BRCA1 C Terminus (BRCT) domain family protein [Leishmania donovani]CAJ1993298.1 BRCA1 C Terminus (BRCT) domain containing protein [Leishmania donovani]